MRRIRLFSALMALLVWPFATNAQQSPADILRTLNFQSGTITLANDLAQIKLSGNFRYLDSADTKTFLTKVWGNPPEAAEGTLGMLVSLDTQLLSADGWAAVVEYEATGYVSDDDAGKIDYDKLMTEMQEAVREESKKRVAKGYDSFELLGWARPPYYDASAKKLYWAKRIRFGNSRQETLNFDVRVLGRRGVLDLNIIAPMATLPSIDCRINNILSMVSFNPGNTYAEYDSKVDSAAAYGLAGLIAGGVLAKAGFFKGLLALLLASKKIAGVAILAAFAGLWGGIKRLLGKR
jgi:uncharacterized membrane-anchored protein